MTTLTRSSRTAAVAVLMSAALAACADRATGPAAAKAEVTSTSSSALWEKEVVGETGPGSTYALYMPHDWNGSVLKRGMCSRAEDIRITRRRSSSGDPRMLRPSAPSHPACPWRALRRWLSAAPGGVA